MKGVSYTAWQPDAMLSEDSNRSLAKARADGCNWIALCVWWFQNNVSSTTIESDYTRYSATPESVVHAINQCHEQGMKVMLKPMVDCRDGEWRGNINPSNDWFSAYQDFISFWAQIAEEHKVELLCIGCELTKTVSWSSSWKNIIQNTRTYYTGPLTYAANHGNEKNVNWWNDLDYIGIDAYYPLTDKNDPTLNELKTAWENRANSLENWLNSNWQEMKIVFAEVGYQSVDGTNRTPWWTDPSSHTMDFQEQAECYEALLSVCRERSWWLGAFWWNWETDPDGGGEDDPYWTPVNKPAEDIMISYYQIPSDLDYPSKEDFETNDFNRFPWRSSGDSNWRTTRLERHSGNYCAESGSIEDGESTTLQLTLDCVSGDITFYRKVSSESGYDYLKFLIDGVEKGEWSGEKDWAEVSFPVDQGKRTFEWTYSKDGSESGGDDTAWIDDIIFPAARETEPTGMPFRRGVNLSDWLSSSSLRQIQFTKFTKQDFINIKSLGCDVIRLPIHLHAMTTGSPDYTIDPLFYYFLDQIIDWAEGLELHLILENVSFDPAVTDIGNILVLVWTQMAQHYKDRSTYVHYEVLNEPYDISDTKWNQIQQEVIDAIRAVDQKHTIIVGPAGYNSYNNLKFMPRYEDDNLIYTFHFYSPFVFTHQGASWPTPSLVPLAGVPFPYDAARMPDCPPELENTWISSNLADYRNTGTPEHVRELIDIAADFKTARDVPLFCGEFGVYMPNSNNEDRIYWYNVVRSYFEQKGIAWTTWDYTGGFGLFEQGTSELFDYDLNIPLVEALGLNAPPQQEFILMPDVSGFDIYLDYIAPNVIESNYITKGILDYYSQDNPASGDYCIHWTGADQYNSISFRFSPVKDLSVLVDEGFAIDFWVRCDSPNARILIRFMDTNTDDPDDHPWRIIYTIDRNVAIWDGRWNHLQIPLSAFFEHGSWDNDRWYNPVGAFDWTATEHFEIVSEYSDMEGIHFYFDNIRVVDTKPPGRP